jgi:hypothetical protein
MSHDCRIRPVTRGPGFHWFGYYDKLEFDPSGRLLLGMEVGFDGRSPAPDDKIEVGMVDLADGDRWIGLGEGRAWCWQQGCMLQWVPGRPDEVVWNDRDGDNYVSHVLSVRTGAARTLPWPVYALAPDGRESVTLDFGRVNDMRPGYGYAGVPDTRASQRAPDDAGIWRGDLLTGDLDLIVSLEQVAGLPWPKCDLSDAKHYVNHLLVNPSGTRFVFLHRWRFGHGPFATRMMTAAIDGSDVRILDDCGHTSHFCWRDARNVLAFSNPVGRKPGFYLFEDGGGPPELVMDDPADGHCLYVPGGESIVCDTYPAGERRVQALYLYHVGSGARRTLGRFAAPRSYSGEWRCDLHPRVSPDGYRIAIDSAHGGAGRQIYLVELGCPTSPTTVTGGLGELDLRRDEPSAEPIGLAGSMQEMRAG